MQSLIRSLNYSGFKYYINIFQICYLKDSIIAENVTLNSENVVVVKSEPFKKKFNIGSCQLGDVFFHPCIVPQAALGYFDNFLNNNCDELMNLFFAQVNWLKNNYTEFKDSYVYPFPFAVDGFGDNPGWTSGMNQGLILSAFVRAFVITEDEHYLHLCEKVYNSLSLSLGDKYGNRIVDDYGPWIEEAMICPPTHILNGFIFAIFGLNDYNKILKRESITEEINDYLHTIKRSLPDYDMGFWSYYDLAGTISSYHYHIETHIPQLRELYKISGIQDFIYYAEKWEGYSNSRMCLLRKKIHSLFQLLYNKLKR